MSEEDDPPKYVIEQVCVERTKRLEEKIDMVNETFRKFDKKVDKVDNRVWWVLGSVVALGFVAILIALLSLRK